MVKSKNKFRDLVGLRFGRLTVVSRDWEKTTKDNSWKVYWLCRCDCGVSKSVRAEHLKCTGEGHHTTSCGCFQKEVAAANGRANRLPIKETACRTLYQTYKKRIIGKQLPFELTRATFDRLLAQPCYYCGVAPGNTFKHQHDSKATFLYNGVDRLDPTKGYTQENVVTACSACNYAKLDMPYAEFLAWLQRVHSNLKSKQLWKES